MKQRIPSRYLALTLLLLLGTVTLSHADEKIVTTDDVRAADGLDDGALDALSALWDRARSQAEATAETKTALHAALRRRWLALGRYSEAVPHAEFLARDRATAQDRVIYAETLLGTVEQRVQRGPSISANISPLLADLLGVTESLSPKPGDLDELLRARAAYVRARGLYLRGRFDEVIAWLEQVGIDSLLEAHRPRLWDLAARCHYEQKRYAAAAEAFARAGNLLAEAAAWSAAKDAGKTAARYAALLQANPNDEQLVQSTLRAVRFAGATEDFLGRLAALSSDVRETPVLLEIRGRLLDGAERTDEALALWRALYAKAPDRLGLRAILARALLAGPQRNEDRVKDEAVGLLEEALQADPEDVLASGLLAGIVVSEYSGLWRDGPQRRGYRRCVRAQRALVAARPDDAIAWANLGNTLRVGGRADEAAKAYARAREENPYDPAIVSDAGLTMAALGYSDKALAAFEESVQLDSGHLAGRQNAARMLWRAGRDQEAAAHLAIGARTARARGQTGMTYRVLMDRTWRTRRNPKLR